MYLFHLVGKFKALLRLFISSLSGLLDHLRIHLCKFERFSSNCLLNIFFCALYAAHHPQMAVRVHCFGLCRCTEEICNLFETFLFGLFGEGEIFSIGLRFTRKGVLQVVHRRHGVSPFPLSYSYAVPLNKGGFRGLCVFRGYFTTPVLPLYPPPEGDRGRKGDSLCHTSYNPQIFPTVFQGVL